nr:hypothetical protein MG436 - Mycoplasma genitalium [Mycoplasmoides genitalium]
MFVNNSQIIREPITPTIKIMIMLKLKRTALKFSLISVLITLVTPLACSTFNVLELKSADHGDQKLKPSANALIKRKSKIQLIKQWILKFAFWWIVLLFHSFKLLAILFLCLFESLLID